MKKFFFFVIVLALFTIFMSSAHANLDYNIKVNVNNELVNFPDQKPFVDNDANRTFVPLRFVSEALGCKVEWQADSGTAIVDRPGTFIEMKTGSSQPLVNGEKKTLDAPARMMNQRTMVPLRFVSEALGCKVDWDGSTRTVIITDATTEPGVPGGADSGSTDGGIGDNGSRTIILPGGGGGKNETQPVERPIPWVD